MSRASKPEYLLMFDLIHFPYLQQSQVFNEREGYNESFLDSLPIIRDDIPDFSPKG